MLKVWYKELTSVIPLSEISLGEFDPNRGGKLNFFSLRVSIYGLLSCYRMLNERGDCKSCLYLSISDSWQTLQSRFLIPKRYRLISCSKLGEQFYCFSFFLRALNFWVTNCKVKELNYKTLTYLRQLLIEDWIVGLILVRMEFSRVFGTFFLRIKCKNGCNPIFPDQCMDFLEVFLVL